MACRASVITYANNDTHTKTGTRKPVPVFCRCVMGICIGFFRCRNLVRSRTLFYLVQETSNHVTKMTSTDWPVVLFVYISCVVCCFYCFKMNWGDSSIEKLIQVYSEKQLCPKNGASFLVPVFGTGFWCVCHWH